MQSNSDIIIYQANDGQTKIDVRLEEETVWLTQEQMARLFDKARNTITEHIQNVFKEGELEEKEVCREYRHTTQHGAIKGKTQENKVKYYNLDIIISVGYRVKSHRGTQFRKWATERLKEYIIKGFTMNDDLLKKAGGGNYFDELLQRIRDIRASEKVFWRKVLDIYATSVDYDPQQEISIEFFKTVQNKLHWAVHGNTAAEVIYNRVNANLPFMGMTSFKGKKPSKQDVAIAKNYLSKDELNILNRMVTAYLEIAEIQAVSHQPMYMENWVKQLNDFLKMTGKDILKHAGVISAEKAKTKALKEYNAYQEKTQNELSEVEKHFIAQIEQTAKKLKEKGND